MQDNLAQLSRDLEHAIQVIVALTNCVRERDIEPPQSLFDASNKAVDTLSAWCDAVRERSCDHLRDS